MNQLLLANFLTKSTRKQSIAYLFYFFDYKTINKLYLFFKTTKFYYLLLNSFICLINSFIYFINLFNNFLIIIHYFIMKHLNFILINLIFLHHCQIIIIIQINMLCCFIFYFFQIIIIFFIKRIKFIINLILFRSHLNTTLNLITELYKS